MTNNQRSTLTKEIDVLHFDSEMEKDIYASLIISMCNSEPSVLLRTILDLNSDKVMNYIEALKRFECIPDEWIMPNNYENSEIRNLKAAKRFLRLEDCSEGIYFSTLQVLVKENPEYILWYFGNAKDSEEIFIMHCILKNA